MTSPAACVSSVNRLRNSTRLEKFGFPLCHLTHRHCITVSPIELILQHRFAPQKSLKTHRVLARCVIAPLRNVVRRALDRRDLLLTEGAQIVIGQWRQQYNTVRPHAALGSGTQFHSPRL